MKHNLTILLNDCVEKYNTKGFIKDDPISVPHRFTKKQDIEIIGLWTAVLAWGQRKTIINKALELCELMDHAPYDFVRNHQEKDKKRFLQFKHRTFQPIDTLYFLEFLQWYYHQHETLEEAFLQEMQPSDLHVGNALMGFRELFFSLPYAPQRTRKHIASPVTKSTCKRLNMFLRWMVRKDESGVDFGIWNRIRPSQLLMPLDVHVDRVARRFGLITRKQTDWQTVLELTENLKKFDAEDPVKYDFALFGMGVLEKAALTKR